MTYNEILGQGDTDELRDPGFDDLPSVMIHDWRRYIPEDIQEVWDTLSFETRAALYYVSEERASNEIWD